MMANPEIHKRPCLIVEQAPMPHPRHWEMLAAVIEDHVVFLGHKPPYLTSTLDYIKQNVIPAAEKDFLVD